MFELLCLFSRRVKNPDLSRWTFSSTMISNLAGFFVLLRMTVFSLCHRVILSEAKNPVEKSISMTVCLIYPTDGILRSLWSLRMTQSCHPEGEARRISWKSGITAKQHYILSNSKRRSLLLSAVQDSIS